MRPFLLAMIVVGVVLLLAMIDSSLFSVPQIAICETNKEGGANDCAIYNPSLYFLWRVGKFAVQEHGFITALATIMIGVFTWRLWNATDELKKISTHQVETSRVSERAYVRMSHTEPGVNPANKKVQMEIRNTGRTPARVVGVRLGPLVLDKGQLLPVNPPYELTVNLPGAQGFLPTTDFFFARLGLIIPDLEWGAITRDVRTLYVIGFVEYIDMFDIWHRAGYARRYAHGRAENNLAFVSGRTYSYDIEILPSERLTSD